MYLVVKLIDLHPLCHGFNWLVKPLILTTGKPRFQLSCVQMLSTVLLLLVVKAQKQATETGAN